MSFDLDEEVYDFRLSLDGSGISVLLLKNESDPSMLDVIGRVYAWNGSNYQELGDGVQLGNVPTDNEGVSFAVADGGAIFRCRIP